MMASEEQNSLGCNEKLSEKTSYEGKFNTLRIISLKAISEFESLQKKCEENYGKYLEERENYIRTRKELDILKEVSGEALGEYQNLHRKYEIEVDCRDQAEEFAKKAVKENKQLKRKSALLISQLSAKVVDIDLDDFASNSENSDTETTEDHGLCNKQIEGLKEQVETLKIRVDELRVNLNETEEKLRAEKEEHKKAKEELENNSQNFKQLKRVSLLALDDYSNLQQKYEVEMQYRAEAEKLAAEVSRDHEAIMKQSDIISKDVTGEERLQKALDEISTLTKQLHDQKTEFDEKVKELEEELASSNDAHKLKILEEKINTFAQGMETLEKRLTDAQQRASEAEAKAKNLEEQLKKAQETTDVPVAPPLPPLPPPPPPPGQLLRKFAGIIGGRKKSTNQKKANEDPRVKAMSEMMDRIKTGKIELRKVQRPKSFENDEGSAMKNLADVLKSLKRSSSKENMRIDNADGATEKHHTFGVQLRKTEDKKPRSLSDSEDINTEFKTLTLRKPRSQSTGDVLDDEEPGMDKDLLKLLKKQKAAAERDDENPKVQVQGYEKEQKLEQ